MIPMRVIRGDYYRAGADPRIEGQGSFFFNNCDLTPKAADVEAGFSVAPGGKVSVHTEELPTP